MPVRPILSALLLLAAPGRLMADETTEPPVAYTLEINGQPYALSPDKPLKITGDFSNPELTLRVAQTRILQAAGVSFSYPSYFTFEADTTDPEVQTWTVSGNDVTIMLFRFAEPVTPRELATSTAGELNVAEPTIEDLAVSLGGKELAGVKATMPLGGLTIIQQSLEIPGAAMGSRMLVVQEVRSAGAAEAAELGAALKLLKSSLQHTP